MTIKNRNIYSALQDIVKYSGYGIRYSAAKKSLIISPYVREEFYIPASIFIDRNAKVSFKSKNLTPEFKSSLNKSVKDIFLDNIAKIGSAEKSVTLDRQTGIVYVKERALYMPEIEKYITDFVKNRIQQFNVQIAMIQINANKSDGFGIDLQNIISQAGRFSINSLAGGVPGISKTVNKDGTTTTVISNGATQVNGTVSMGKNISFDWLLGALNKRGYSNVITKPNMLVQNHSIGYMSLIDKVNYIAGWNTKTSTTTGRVISKTPKIESVEEGMEFLVKVSKFPHKNFIQVSAVPSIKSVDFSQVYQTPDGEIKMPTTSILSTFSVANIHSGDLIVLSGFKKKTNINNFNSPLISKVPIIGKTFNQQQANNNYKEFAFLIKVTQLNNARDTFKNPSNTAKQLYRQF